MLPKILLPQKLSLLIISKLNGFQCLTESGLAEFRQRGSDVIGPSVWC